MQWQDALLADPEALDDFYAWAATEIGYARDAIDQAIDASNLHGAAVAKGRKDALMAIVDSIAAIEREGHADGDRRQAHDT